MKKYKLVGISSGVILFGLLGYFILLSNTGDVRLTDNELNIEEMGFIELALFAYAILGTLATWAISLRKSYKNQQRKWFIFLLFAWPLTIFYVAFGARMPNRY